MPTPEQIARQHIDCQLAAAGWTVQDYKKIDLTAAPAIAVREFRLTTGPVDYLLYVDGRVIGTIEAKPKGHTLTGVEIQSTKYGKGLPPGTPSWTPDGQPLAFAYESTGTITQFTSGLDPVPRSREVFSFHRPEELEQQVRAKLQNMPALETGKLWDKQITAIKSVEASLAHLASAFRGSTCL